MPLVIPNLDRLSFEYTENTSDTVELLSLYDCPNCTSRGSGLPIGNTATIQVSATGDDGSWMYNGTFYDNTVEFGDITPTP